MEYLKKEIIDLMRTLVIKLSMTSSSDIIKILSQELDSLTKAYMALEGKKCYITETEIYLMHSEGYRSPSKLSR